MDQNFQLPNINGWLVINKPSGIGSTNIVNLVKKKIPSMKVGHGGTLDPDATGLLPIAIGEATKTIRFTENLLKTYINCFKLSRIAKLNVFKFFNREVWPYKWSGYRIITVSFYRS